MVHAFPSSDPALATRFLHCRFTDDASLTPNGRLYVGGGPIVNLAESRNVLFDTCNFALTGEGVLPWSWEATYRDCTMRQASKVTAITKGKYVGRSVIDAPANLYGSMIMSTVVVNGDVLPPGPVGDFAPSAPLLFHCSRSI